MPTNQELANYHHHQQRQGRLRRITRFRAPRRYFDSSRSSAKYLPQIAGRECVPCPRVSSVIGSRTNLPRFTFLISLSMMPSSGGLISSSAELTARSGALILSSWGAGLYKLGASVS